MTAIPRRGRNVGAAIIGNTLEWFDILVYAYFVKAIAATFFPAANADSSLLLAYGTFGLSFVARPLGAVVLGHIADRRGRRTALLHASAYMFAGTLAIAVLPGYASVGILAPVLMLAARLLQGFSVGGEFGSAAAYLAEQSADRRAFYSSLQFAGQGMGMVCAALAGLALANWLTPDAIMAWGWRIPFLIGAMLGPVAYLVRRNADETPEFLSVETPPPAGPSGAMDFVQRCAVGACAVLLCNVAIYFLVYIPTFAQAELAAAPSIAFSSALVSGATLVLGAPLAGWSADRVGALRHGMVAAVVLLIVTYPIFAAMVGHAGIGAILLGQFGLALVTAMYVGALPAILADLFDTRRRSLGVSIAYNVAVMTGGGFAQMIFVALIAATGNVAAPAWYVVVAAAVSVLALLQCRSITAVDRRARAG